MIIPYLAFQGACEEAFLLYASIFGGKIEYLSRYTEETGGPSLAGKVMHAHVSLGSGGVSGADQAAPVAHTEAIRLMIHCASRAEAERYFDALAADGGHAIARLTPHPPPDVGMDSLVQDKYGYQWILTAPSDK